MVEPLVPVVLVASQLQHLDAKLEAREQHVLQVLRHLINNDKRSEGAFEHQPIQHVVEIAIAVRGGIVLALLFGVCLSLERIEQNGLDSAWCFFK